jgi:hypothetical protein
MAPKSGPGMAKRTLANGVPFREKRLVARLCTHGQTCRSGIPNSGHSRFVGKFYTCRKHRAPAFGRSRPITVVDDARLLSSPNVWNSYDMQYFLCLLTRLNAVCSARCGHIVRLLFAGTAVPNLLNYAVGAFQQPGRHRHAQLACSLEINHQLAY